MCRKCPRSIPSRSSVAVSSKATAIRRRGLFGLSLLALVLTVGVGIVLWQAVELSSVSRVSVQVDQLKSFASVVRLVIITLLAALWPRVVELADRYARIDTSKRDDLLAQRWRVAGWLLVIEIVLGQNLFGRFFAVTSGPVV